MVFSVVVVTVCSRNISYKRNIISLSLLCAHFSVPAYHAELNEIYDSMKEERTNKSSLSNLFVWFMGNVCGNTRRQVELEAKQEESRGNSEQPPSITPLKSPALKKSKSALLLLSPVALFSPRNHGNEEEVLDVEISDELVCNYSVVT